MKSRRAKQLGNGITSLRGVNPTKTTCAACKMGIALPVPPVPGQKGRLFKCTTCGAVSSVNAL